MHRKAAHTSSEKPGKRATFALFDAAALLLFQTIAFAHNGISAVEERDRSLLLTLRYTVVTHQPSSHARANRKRLQSYGTN